MRKKLLKILAVICTCTIFMQTVPWNVFAMDPETVQVSENADELEETTEDIEPAEGTSPAEDSEPEIIAEDTAKREENIKHFRLSDGTYLAVEYSTPVHYQSETGEWQDYDNTLEANRTGLFRSVQSYSVQKSDHSITLTKQAKENSMFSVAFGNGTLSWGYAKARKSTMETVEKEELTGNDRFLTLSNIAQEVWYKSIYKDVDLQAYITAQGVKENLILNSKDAVREYKIEYQSEGLTPVQEDASAVCLQDENGETVYTIAAPAMTDANGEISTDLSLSMTVEDREHFTLTLTADSEWLDNAAYPVTIDPVLSTDKSPQTQDYATLCTSTSGSRSILTTGSLLVGRSTTYNKMNSLVRINTLPTLGPGDSVVSAKFYALQIGYSSGTGNAVQVNLSKVTSAWSKSTLVSSGFPSYSPLITDYALASNATKWTSGSSAGMTEWDVTPIVKGWYNGESNYGLTLWPQNAEEYTYANYTPANSYTGYPEECYPCIIVGYLNTAGTEGYLSYHQQEAGRAGTGYVNDYSGQLTLEHTDFSESGLRMPVIVSHVYNSVRAGKSFTGTNWKSGAADVGLQAGLGWQLNLFQRLDSVTDIPGYDYVYLDGDGTLHYLKKASGESVWRDEEGLGLTLTVSGTKVLEDKEGNKMTFTAEGYLLSIADAEGNALSLRYTGPYLSSVKDGAGRVTTLTYNSYGYLLSIIQPDGNTTLFGYNGALLDTIIYPDGKKTKYTYSGNLISAAKDPGGYSVQYGYNAKNQVTGVTEYGSSGAQGDTLGIQYNTDNTTTFTYQDDRNETCTEQYGFDSYGRNTYVVDNQGNAQFVKFQQNTGTSGKNNKITQTSKLQTSILNLLFNTGGEYTGQWGSLQWGTGSASVTRTAEDAFIGRYSYKLASSDSGTTIMNIQQAAVTPGQTYTFSSYVKIGALNQPAPGDGAFAAVSYLNGSGATVMAYSETVTVAGSWDKVSVTFTLPADAASGTVTVRTGFCGSGYAYFDCMQLETGETANRYNMVENSSFELVNSDGTTAYWTGSAGTSSSTRLKFGFRSGQVTGSATEDRFFKQSFAVNSPGASEKDAYVFGCWAKGDSAEITENVLYHISAYVTYTDGTSGPRSLVAFNWMSPLSSGWQYACGAISADDGNSSTAKIPQTITLYFQYYDNVNAAFCDGVQLFKEEFGDSYQYDESGNLISTQSIASQKSAFTYNGSNELSGYVSPKGYNYSYVYHNAEKPHRLTSVKSEASVNYELAYHSSGVSANLLREFKTGLSAEDHISTFYTYDQTGNYVDTVTDSLGNSVDYNYNATTGLLENYTDADGNITAYQYDEETYALLAVSSGQAYARYQYTDDNLTSLRHSTDSTAANDVVYSFTYDEFGNPLTTNAGPVTLMTNLYHAIAGGSQNGLLSRSTYGNGDRVDYTYDSFDRVISRTYNQDSGKTVGYTYDAEGQIAKVSDSLSGALTQYYYDTTGRLIRKTENDLTTSARLSSGIYKYDDTNNISQTTYNFGTGNSNLTTYYSYVQDNRASSVNLYLGGSSSLASITRGYDSIGRETVRDLVTGSAVYKRWRTAYDYVDGSNGLTTTLLSSVTNNGSVLSYTYDKNGNIKTISEDGVLKAAYFYDGLNQICREDNVWLGRTIRYEYDNGGNLLAKYQYPYSYDPADTKGENFPDTYESVAPYEYGDAGWKDKLTSYNGQAIAYDEIGNPVSYKGTSMTWDYGRRLMTVGNDISYVYNGDGVRVSKTVGGVKTEYLLDGSTVIGEKTGGAYTWYYYDADGRAAMMIKNGACYYYAYNGQGDVIGLYNDQLEWAARYQYDSWGKLLAITDGSGNDITEDAESVGYQNPFRYRGYYYDSETGFYWLQSRYYDPVIGRFLNADNQVTTGSDLTGMNLFAYCGNNPVNRADPTGHAWWHWAIAATVVVACAVAVVVTAGGITPALMAVASVANGIAAATTVSTIAAGAFIGSATVYSMAVMSAAASSSSPQEFADQGSWGTIAATAGGAVLGGAGAYSSTKSATSGKGTQNPKVKAAVQKGQAMHKQMDYGPGTLKEVTIAPKCRVDGIDFSNRIIYELKPNNPQAIARGMSQLNRYTSAASSQFGGEWTGVLKLYD